MSSVYPQSFAESLQKLISKFDADKQHYLSKDYPEAQGKIDFTTPLSKTLGWDPENDAGLPHHMREVIVGYGESHTTHNVGGRGMGGSEAKMFCTKCGKKGFPVRIACTACNATLPDVPAILGAPEERTKPKEVICARCGSTAHGARIACIDCDTTFPQPFRLSDSDGPIQHDPRVAYYSFWCSADACEECRKFDGLTFLPSNLSLYRVPIATCKYPVCWCEIQGHYSDEGTLTMSDQSGAEVVYDTQGGAADLVAFLRCRGGSATEEEIQSYLDGESAPDRDRTERANAICELWQRAYRLEKIYPDQSMGLYRESIQAWKAALRSDPEFRWDYL